MKAFTLIGLLAFATTAPALQYQYSGVDFPGAVATTVYAVNDLGQYVGAEREDSGVHHAILNDGVQLRLLDASGIVGTSAQSWAFSINSHGDIAGTIIDANGSSHGYLYHGADGTVTTIDYPGGFDSQAYGVNDCDEIIGVYNDADGNPHAFRLSDGQFSPLDLDGSVQTVPLSINNRGEVVGEYVTDPTTNGYGFIDYPGDRVRLITAPGSQPLGTYFISINNHQQILGQYLDDAGNPQNFVRLGNHYSIFNLPSTFAASFVSAQTINDHGEIVGYYLDASSVAHGFVALPQHAASGN